MRRTLAYAFRATHLAVDANEPDGSVLHTPLGDYMMIALSLTGLTLDLGGHSLQGRREIDSHFGIERAFGNAAKRAEPIA